MSAAHDPGRGLGRLPTAADAIGDQVIESIRELGHSATLEAIEQDLERWATPAAIAQAIAELRVKGLVRCDYRVPDGALVWRLV
jgi:hypothetical protein